MEQMNQLVRHEESVISQASNMLTQCFELADRSQQCPSSAFPPLSRMHQFVECNQLLLVACQRRQVYCAQQQRYSAALKLFRSQGRAAAAHSLGISPTAYCRPASLHLRDLRLCLKPDFLNGVGVFASMIIPNIYGFFKSQITDAQLGRGIYSCVGYREGFQFRRIAFFHYRAMSFFVSRFSNQNYQISHRFTSIHLFETAFF